MVAVSGRPEEGGEERAHPAEGAEPPVLVVEAEEPGYVLAQAAAYLQRRALAARAAAAQMRERRGGEDDRHQERLYRPALVYGVDDRVRPEPVEAQRAVHERNRGPGYGQQP